MGKPKREKKAKHAQLRELGKGVYYAGPNGQRWFEAEPGVYRPRAAAEVDESAFGHDGSKAERPIREHY